MGLRGLGEKDSTVPMVKLYDMMTDSRAKTLRADVKYSSNKWLNNTDQLVRHINSDACPMYITIKSFEQTVL